MRTHIDGISILSWPEEDANQKGQRVVVTGTNWAIRLTLDQANDLAYQLTRHAEEGRRADQEAREETPHEPDHA